MIARYRFSALYFAAIVVTNILYARFGDVLIWQTPFDATQTWSPLAIIVGFWFILRDYAQRELGRGVLLVMLAGMVASYVMAGGAVGTASAIAFAAGELVDWAVFSKLKDRPFAKRVLYSSLAAAPVDTILFFYVADMVQVVPGVQLLSWPTVLTETLSKFLAVAVIYRRISRTTGNAALS